MIVSCSRVSPKPEKSARWTDGLDEAEVDEALTNAIVDTYDDYEQHTGLLTAIEDELAFPFPVQVLGETVTAVHMAWPEKDEFGLDLVMSGMASGIQSRRARSICLRRFPSDICIWPPIWTRGVARDVTAPNASATRLNGLVKRRSVDRTDRDRPLVQSSIPP